MREKSLWMQKLSQVNDFFSSALTASLINSRETGLITLAQVIAE
jgi:hypothetical protein